MALPEGRRPPPGRGTLFFHQSQAQLSAEMTVGGANNYAPPTNIL
jgi:hypothetical protein